MAERAGKAATFSIVGDHVVGEVFDGEAIIINTVTGAYYSLPGEAAAVWTALANGATTAHAIHAAAGTAAELVQEVLAELVAEGLVVTEGAMPEPSLDRQPHLAKYSDMEELLLLDPIHDVAPTGWPIELGDTSGSDPTA